MSWRLSLRAALMIALLSSLTLSSHVPGKPPEYVSGVGDVQISLNGGDDVAYIGKWNTVEIWIINDQPLLSMSMGFEFSIGRDYYFDPAYGAFGYVNPENDAQDAFDLYHDETEAITDLTPDSILIAGAALSHLSALPTHEDYMLCYTMRVYIEAGQEELADGFSIDNIFFPPTGNWTFHDGTSYPPLFQGNENTSETVPDAPPVDFDIVYADLENMRLSQIDWYNSDDELVLQYSTWGLFNFVYKPDSIDTYYLNLSLAQLGDPLQWVIQNLPLFPSLDTSLHSDGAHINLEDIGIFSGDSAGVFEMAFSISNTPESTMPTAPVLASIFTHSRRMALDHLEDMGEFTDPGVPASIRIPDSAVQIGTTRDMDPIVDTSYRVQEAARHCMAGACARSLDWLNRVHQLGMDMDAQEIYDSLVGRNVSAPDQGGEFSRDEWTEYKNEFAREKSGNKIVTKVWDAGDYMPELDSTIEESNENFLDWLKREIKTEDVEIAYAYDAGGAHIVTAVDVFEDTDGNVYVKYRDDERQADSLVGDASIKTTRLVERDDGTYGFDSENNFIFFALSESVVSTTTGGQEDNTTVHNVVEIHQDAFRNPRVANDLHFRVHTDIEIKGWKIKVPGFGDATSSRVGTDSVKVNADIGAVPYCTYLPIDIELYLHVWNQLVLDQIVWTRNTGDKDPAAIDSVKAAPGFGWMIEPPVETSPGTFEHVVHICNYDTEEWFELTNIALWPENTYYYDIAALSYIDFPIQLPSIDLMPLACYTYVIEESGLSDHVYGHFSIVDFEVDTVIHNWFDHPTRPTIDAVCGDANGDETVNVGDAVYIIGYVFKGGPAPEPLCAADANGDGDVNVGDAVWLISYVFKGGPPPVEGCCN